MARLRRLVLLLALACAAPADAAIELTLVAGGIPHLVGIEHPGDGSGRLFLVSQAGRILVYDGAGVLPSPFLDISGSVRFSGEQGLLGLAFHPDYASNGCFYVHYSDTSGHTVIARYRVSADPNVADPTSATVVLTEDQPFSNHNGGQMRFGPDGFLYIALGDGGSGGDPQNNGQRLETLLGKLLRIDVDAASPYAVPTANPFVGTPGARPEIWAYGLRNPWRFSFDRDTGDVFIADVGQGSWEEVSFQPAGAGGRNYGWRLMEGAHCFNPSSDCNDGSLVLPIVEYSHEFGCSVTGGFRYRGATLAAHVGTYFYGDFCSGRIWGATADGDGAWTAVELLDTNLLIATFGEDAAGEIYVGHYAAPGQLYRITPGSSFTDDPLVPGVTPVRAVHVTELRVRIEALRATSGLPSFAWTDPAPSAGSTAIRAVHVTEMRVALGDAYAAAGRPLPAYTDAALGAGAVIRAVHIAEIREAVLALE